MITSYINGRKLNYIDNEWVEVPCKENFKSLLKTVGLNPLQPFTNNVLENGERFRFDIENQPYYSMLEISVFDVETQSYTDWKAAEPKKGHFVLIDVMMNNFHIIMG